ncbi:MAG: rRNA pseudouridine synthase [Ruminococcaceae bacterium]|nr:rRNA pseudouridine synthase [Oscillospiraceae bacterium]
MGNTEKLQKIIAAAGVCSRRKAEELISEGRVAVNGITAAIGDKAGDLDEITIDGRPLPKKSENVYFMLNKPKGYVTTAADEKGRKNVTELINEPERVYPVGRLDMYSEGLLIMTNDGELTYKLTHPRHELYKEYLVGMMGDKSKDAVRLMENVREIDGYKIAKPIVRKVSETDYGFVLSVKIREGRNRQIRKMCESCGYKVIFLKRVAVGSLKLGELKAGQYRALTQAEVDMLMKEAGNGEK